MAETEWDTVQNLMRQEFNEYLAPDGFVRSNDEIDIFLAYLARVMGMIYRVTDLTLCNIIRINIKRQHYLESQVRVQMARVPRTEPGETCTLLLSLFVKSTYVGHLTFGFPADVTRFFSSSVWTEISMRPIQCAESKNGELSDPDQCCVCEKKGTMLVCARCRRQYYCSAACQRQDWKRHKPVCLLPNASISLDDIGIDYRDRRGQIVEQFGNSNPKIRLNSTERNCFGNCTMHVDLLKYAGVDLHIVGGSLGLCDPAPTWFEWGGNARPHTTVNQFRTDIHFWMEDASGNVWDVLDSYLMRVVVPVHGKKVKTKKFRFGRFVTGMPKNELQTRGLVYIPAPAHIQDILLREETRALKIAFV
jgi:hypothetical protein